MRNEFPNCGKGLVGLVTPYALAGTFDHDETRSRGRFREPLSVADAESIGSSSPEGSGPVRAEGVGAEDSVSPGISLFGLGDQVGRLSSSASAKSRSVAPSRGRRFGADALMPLAASVVCDRR